MQESQEAVAWDDEHVEPNLDVTAEDAAPAEEPAAADDKGPPGPNRWFATTVIAGAPTKHELRKILKNMPVGTVVEAVFHGRPHVPTQKTVVEF